MNLDQFFAEYNGPQNASKIIYNPTPQRVRDYLGQCVQLAMLYNDRVLGGPVIWVPAAKDYALPHAGFTFIANNPSDPNQVPPRGAMIVWGADQPGSGGYGHIGIVWDARPGAATFVSFDSNWGGKYAHLVTHTYTHILGWVIKDSAPAPAAAQPVTQGVEMIANDEQAHDAYKLLRPNGDGTPDEIAATSGRRSWAEFASSARNEVSVRDAALRDQAAHLQSMQQTINDQNQTITDLTSKIHDATVSAQDKAAALNSALDQVAAQNASLANSHDAILDLQKQLDEFQGNPDARAAVNAAKTAKNINPIVRMIAALIRR